VGLIESVPIYYLVAFSTSMNSQTCVRRSNQNCGKFPFLIFFAVVRSLLEGKDYKGHLPIVICLKIELEILFIPTAVFGEDSHSIFVEWRRLLQHCDWIAMIAMIATMRFLLNYFCNPFSLSKHGSGFFVFVASNIFAFVYRQGGRYHKKESD